ncbi:MAG: glycosyltransferase family 39 protein [Candidatus Levyibacteriota bacterium]|nr:MAG: glycosyltransferase family 39 protein [Candidatus Levybacteria bacterium]
MDFVNKYKKEIIFFALLVLLFFFTRLYRLDSLPMFTDEAIYVRWSQIAKQDASWRFISLTDGKQPTFIWTTLIMMRFVSDPLLAGRLASVMAGFFTMLGLFFLGREVFYKRWIGLISSALYVVFPMALVYDRMALYDTMVGTFAVWSLFLAILLVRNLRLDTALLLGFSAGAGVLTKTSGFFNIYLLPLLFLLFDFKKQNLAQRLFRFVGLLLLVVALTQLYYSVLRLSPFFYIIAEKNALFVYTWHDWLDHPFNFFYGNLKGVWDWFLTYTTWSGVILIFGSYVVYKNQWREKAVLTLWFIIPFLTLAIFGKTLYPRFILFMILSLLPLMALSLYFLSVQSIKKPFIALCFIIVFVLPLQSDYFILLDFAHSPIPKSDLGQYINNWPAGGGVKELVALLKDQAAYGKIFVASEGTFGSLPTYTVEIYLGNNPNIDKRGIWPITAEIPEDILAKAKIMPTFVVFNNSRFPPPKWPLIFVAKYQKGIGDAYMSVYKVDQAKVKHK